MERTRTDGAAVAKRPESSVSSVWDPQLIERLYEVLYKEELSCRALDAEIEILEAQYGAAVFAELIHVLSHLRFEPERAREHWVKILAHRDRMQAVQATDVDLRVALVTYFVEDNRRFQTPKVIELKLFEQTQASAYVDELTGLHNFRLLQETLYREVRRSRQSNSPLSLIMLDIDDFKVYNDRNGHDTGNEVLRGFADVLKQSIRKMDIAARYGGEEFVILLPDTHKIAAHEIAEAVCLNIANQPFPFEADQPRGKLTASVGVATCPADAGSEQALIRAADRAMYVAKAEGKNQVRLYGADRRSYRRVEATLAGSYRVFDSGERSMTTINLSEGGILFAADQPLAVGSLIEADVALPETDSPLRIAGRIVSVKPTEDGKFETGTRTIEIDRDRGIDLRRYLKSFGELPTTVDA